MRGQMQFFSYSDANIYDPLIVKEWMDEVCNAAMYYLVDQKSKSKLWLVQNTYYSWGKIDSVETKKNKTKDIK